MSPAPISTTRLVESRASGRCEYCRMHQSLQGATFHLEHIIPSSHGGSEDLENLAWCCPSCNLHKSDRTHAIDPATGASMPMFHPRHDRWADHFEWNGYEIFPLTAVGRATASALKFNAPRKLMIRRAEEQFGFFPPRDVK